MEAIHFEVGAKAARLIGRENISDSDGALMELIKNAYDADASCVYVLFDMPFPYIPSEIDAEKILKILTKDDQKKIFDFYIQDKNGKYLKKDNLSEDKVQELWKLFTEYNTIVVIDNGNGMTLSDVRTKWMYIGTSDKEVHIESPKGRIKTGAKGIGRFALDKLSFNSRMLTSNQENSLVDWQIDWEQFENSKLLTQVTAILEEKNNSYEEVVKELLKKQNGYGFDRENEWETGTAIILHPVREEWTYRMFDKINTNLKSINPLGAADPFKVLVRNQYFPEYNFETADVAIDVTDYDYKIEIQFDGNKIITTSLTRNEVNIYKKDVTFKDYSKKESLNSFWNRPYFQREKYRKEDFEGTVKFIENALELVKDDPAKIRNVGPFKAELYFVKSKNSTSEIIKKIKVKKRRELLKKFSGIKLYRDQFKVRPYGDEDNDWLELAKRQAESPGGVGSDSGSWRVLSYQLIGQVIIGRRENPALYDMANREGLTQNDEYHILVNLLQNSIHIFESDRQNFYREYAKWYREVEKTFGMDANIRADVQNKYNNTKSSILEKGDRKKKQSEKKYTDAEYENTIYKLMREKKEMLNASQILQLLSSNGLILSTFFHEFKAIQSQFFSRAEQLKVRLEYMESHNTFHPVTLYDPMIIINKMEETDKMLNLWLQVAMDGIEKENLLMEKIALDEEINNIMHQWSGLLESKDINYRIQIDDSKEYLYEFSKADLYIIFNNFLLNSAYFLEKEHNPQRKILISLLSEKEHYFLRLWNNGPKLAEEYATVPDRIFELGISSKKEGTGIGLWIMKETVERYNGTIMVSKQETGFGLDIYLKK